MTHTYKGRDYSELLKILNLKDRKDNGAVRSQVWNAVTNSADVPAAVAECRAYLAAHMSQLTINDEELSVYNALSHIESDDLFLNIFVNLLPMMWT